MPTLREDLESSLLRYLPAIYLESSVPGAENEFASQFLRCFEEILLGDGLERAIIRIPSCLEPNLADPEFLPWLAGWVALSLRTDLPLKTQRRLIAGIVPYYLWRGTKRGLEKILRLATGTDSIFISEPKYRPLQVGERSTVGKDTYLAGGPPHFFLVKVEFPEPISESSKKEMLRLIREIIDLEKPAHTSFVLEEHSFGETGSTESGPLAEPLADHRGNV